MPAGVAVPAAGDGAFCQPERREAAEPAGISTPAADNRVAVPSISRNVDKYEANGNHRSGSG